MAKRAQKSVWTNGANDRSGGRSRSGSSTSFVIGSESINSTAMRLRVVYDRPEELLADHEAQFQRGGVLVRVEPPAGLQLWDTVELEVATGFAGSVVVPGQVVQLVPGAGVAVTFDPKELAGLVEAARAGGKAAKPAGPK